MVLDGGDANAIEMAPTTTLVFRINVLGLMNVHGGKISRYRGSPDSTVLHTQGTVLLTKPYYSGTDLVLK